MEQHSTLPRHKASREKQKAHRQPTHFQMAHRHWSDGLFWLLYPSSDEQIKKRKKMQFITDMMENWAAVTGDELMFDVFSVFSFNAFTLQRFNQRCFCGVAATYGNTLAQRSSACTNVFVILLYHYVTLIFTVMQS